MTREEAIRELREDKALYETDNCHAGDGSPDGDLLEAIDMAIEALKQFTGKLNNPDDSLLTTDPEACKEQKSKLDRISRAEAIEAVRLKSAKCGLLGRGDILDILSSLPSAENEWIPVSERLPDEEEIVLTSDSIGHIDFGQYDRGQWYWLAEACTDYWIRNDGVIAWMPLPKPYKGGERSEE